MRPVVNFYGGKWALAKRYGPPQRKHVIEPFAGFAGYSTYWEPQRVLLIEKDPQIVAVWHFLRRASQKEIMSIPHEIKQLDDLRICQEAKWLVAWWFDKGMSEPAKSRSQWARNPKYQNQFWGQKIRARIANQLEKIRNWKIIQGDYTAAPDIEAHWLIDPPYQQQGKHYRCNSIDYSALAQWCLSRKGYVQVCESTDARWLPFQPFALVTSHRPKRFSAEAIYEFETAPAYVKGRRSAREPINVPVDAASHEQTT